MTRRVPCPPAPGPLEAYAAQFDDLFSTLAQRRGFRENLTGLLLPRDRNKTLTCLAGVEPVAGAQHPAVQRLQFFLSESTWDHERVNARRVQLLLADSATAPHSGGVLVIDDSGDRKDGNATAHVGRQWLGRLGKTDNGIVTVTTCWADENIYYPLHAVPKPRPALPRGQEGPRIPHETADRSRTGPHCQVHRGGFAGRGRRLRLRRPGRLPQATRRDEQDAGQVQGLVGVVGQELPSTQGQALSAVGL
ncbi:transposase [Streptomyces sp. NPDC051098]|uniref:IS701 family transposase n=1 Tax=Streptomyces sp. NPDC051098 TaxID=3155411 RepID=UPI003445D4C6